MATIDAALQAGINLSTAQLAEVKRLRERLHKTGNHGESVKVLGEARGIFGIN